MRRRRFRIGVSAALVLLMLAFQAAVAMADDGLPPTPLNLDPARIPLYEKYSLWSYTVDTPVSDGSLRQLLHLLNGLNLTRAWVVKLAIRTAEYALTWRLPQTFADLGAKVTEALRVLLWEGSLAPLVTAGIVVSGLMLLWLVLRGRGRTAWEHLLRLCAVLVFGAMVTGAAGPALRTLSALSGEVSTALLTEPARAMAPSSEGKQPEQVRRWAVTAAGDAVWQSFVLDPWAVHEFGSMESAKRYAKDGTPGAAVLEMAPARRLDWYWAQPITVRERDLAWWNEEGMPRRLTLAGVTTLGALLCAAALFLLAGTVVVQQLLFVLLTMLAPLVFVIALWPGLGRHWVARWSQGVVRALLGQVVASSVLGLFLMVVLVVAELESDAGWELPAGLLVALAVAVLGLRRLMAVRRRGRHVVESPPALPQRQAPAATERPGGAPAPVVVSTSPSSDVAPAGMAPAAVMVPGAVPPDPALADLAGELAEGRTRALLESRGDSGLQRPAALPLPDRGPSGALPGSRSSGPVGRPAPSGGQPSAVLVLPTRPK